MKKLFLATIETTSSFACDVTKFKTLGGIRVSATAFELAEDTDGQTRAKLTFTPLLNVDGFQMVPFTEGKTVTLVDFENDGVGTGETDVVVKTCTSSYFTFDHSGPIPTKMGEVFTSNFPFIATSDFLLRRTSGVTINLDEADIDWGLGQEYTIDFTEGFVIDPNDDGFASPASTVSYTTNSTAPSILDHNPVNNGTNITNNTTIKLTYDRTVKPGTGYIRLYKTGGVLVKAFDVTNFSEVAFFGSEVTVKTKGYMAKNTSYYILTDANAIKDLEKISAAALTSQTDYFFTTANATFPDLSASMTTAVTASATAKVILAADRYLSPAEGDAVYLEDTYSNILYAPQVADYSYDGSGTYTVTVTPSTTAAVESLGNASNSMGGTQSFNATTKVLTLTGTRDQVNTRLSQLRLDGGVDFDQPFTLSYTVTTPRSATMTKVQNVVLSTIQDYELFRVVGYDRQYYANQSNLIWNTPWIETANTQLLSSHVNDYQPYVSDMDNPDGFVFTDPRGSATGSTDTSAYTGTYTIELSATSGQFSSLSDDSDKTANWSYTGTKNQMDLKFATIKFWPNPGVNTNTSFNVVFKKGSTTTLSTSVGLIYQGSAAISETITFTSSGTWTPTANQLLYGILDFLIVGGGGAGGNMGGGGGGGVKEVIGQTLTAGTYTITVGAGGTGNQTSTAGTAGGSSSAFGFTATGGNPAAWATSTPFPRAGSTGTPTTAGASTSRLGGSPSYTYNSYAVTGGGGGGGNGAAGSNSSSTSGSGGAGGAGFTSTITGLAYGAGGGGRGINHDATVTGWNGGNGGNGGSGVGGRGSTLTTTSTSPSITSFATDGAANSGSGGGGGYYTGPVATGTYGGNGADGVVVIRVRNQ